MIVASIAQSAARLRFAVIALMVILGLLYAAARFGIALGPLRFEYRHHLGAVQPSSLVSDLSLALLGLALYRLTQMLHAIAGGDYFSEEVVRRFRGFAFWLLVMALLGAVGPILIALAGAPGHDALTLKLDVRQILTAGIALILFLFARLLERARELDAEMKEIV